MSFVIAPFTIKDVTIDVIEDALPVGLVVTPLSFIACAIWPCLLAKTMAEATKPLAAVDSTVFKSVFTLFMSLFFISFIFGTLFTFLLFSIILAFFLPKMVLCMAQSI